MPIGLSINYITDSLCQNKKDTIKSYVISYYIPFTRLEEVQSLSLIYRLSVDRDVQAKHYSPPTTHTLYRRENNQNGCSFSDGLEDYV